MAPKPDARRGPGSGHAAALLAVLAVLAVLAALATTAAGVRAAERRPDLAAAEHDVVARANAFRREHRLAPTTPNAQLTAAARDFAAYMARSGRYAHDADGRQPTQRAQDKGYAWCLVAENIAFRYSSAGFATDELARGFVQGWIDSAGHRRNLLDGEATETGVAIRRSERSARYYAVQMFGRPASLRVRFEIANRSSRSLSYRLGDESYALAHGVTRTHEQCRPLALSVQLPGAEKALRIEPADGARYRIEGQGDALRFIAG